MLNLSSGRPPYPYRFPIASLLLHCLQGQLPARLPGIGPSGVGGDVADGVADHGIGDPIDHAGGALLNTLCVFVG